MEEDSFNSALNEAIQADNPSQIQSLLNDLEWVDVADILSLSPTPILQSFGGRAIWLGANLLTAFLASSIINLFEETIEQVVALAVLMPIIASMGGVTGSQTLTLVIRDISQGAIHGSNSSWLIRRKMLWV